MLKKTKEMKPGALYLLKSVACSNTVYFESLMDCKTFLRLANRHLKDYLYIHEYMLTKDGWVILARMKSKSKILEAYRKKRERNEKGPKELPPWKIISEQIRLFISGFVTKYNEGTGREGSLVKRPYERYYFETVKGAKRIIKRIRRRLIGLQQAKKMYRAKKGHYRIPKNKGGIYLSSKRKKRVGLRVRGLLDLTVFQQLTTKVLAKGIKKSRKLKKHSPNPKIPDS